MESFLNLYQITIFDHIFMFNSFSRVTSKPVFSTCVCEKQRRSSASPLSAQASPFFAALIVLSSKFQPPS